MNIKLIKPELQNDWADMPLTDYEEKALAQGRQNMKRGDFLTLQEFKLSRNIEKLNEIAALKDNWDGYGAAPFAHSVIASADSFLRKLLKQPEIFPTADMTIQMEYENENGDYLEFQFADNPTCEVYMSEGDNVSYFTIERTPEDFNSLVNDFYGRSL